MHAPVDQPDIAHLISFFFMSSFREARAKESVGECNRLRGKSYVFGCWSPSIGFEPLLPIVQLILGSKYYVCSGVRVLYYGFGMMEPILLTVTSRSLWQE